MNPDDAASLDRDLGLPKRYDGRWFVTSSLISAHADESEGGYVNLDFVLTFSAMNDFRDGKLSVPSLPAVEGYRLDLNVAEALIGRLQEMVAAVRERQSRRN